MDLLNVSFGIFAFMPLGWLFMLFVIFLECFSITRLLTPKWIDKRIYGITTLTNIISGLAGIIISIILNGGWYLVVWFPWVSSNELNLSNTEEFNLLLNYYAAAFLLTLLIEISTNSLFLGRRYPLKKVLIATIVVNIFSYAVGTAVLYSYSFSIIK